MDPEARRTLRAAWPPVAAALTLLVATAGGAQEEPATPDLLATLGYTVTGGAAPGYVPDRACALCHSERWHSYQEVGMARSFFRPSREREIEDFAQSYFHAKSQRRYEMGWQGDRLLFRRYQLDGEGRPINLLEQEVDWVLGSGHHSRTYLFRTPGGELYQLPLAWYSQGEHWGMAPGYDRPDHLGVGRRVRRECMFCHNGYPDVPAGSDRDLTEHRFPAELPEGTGCQRCHGPGAEHVRRALGGGGDRQALRAAIVNPRRLSPERRNDICFGCHLQPSVALPGVGRFGRGDYAFRPGRALADSILKLDVDEAGRERSERFEINHHPYRLLQSRCYRESQGELSCLTCHDPHRKVPAAERAAHYRAACLGCHQVEDCGLPAMLESAEAAGAELPTTDPGDCATCHMPKRRTQDVVQVVMTDHLIQRRPGGPELLAPLEESEPVLVGVDFFNPEEAPDGALAEVYRAAAVLQAGVSAEAVDYLEKMLPAAGITEVEPYLLLARSQLALHRFADAESNLRTLLERSSDQPVAREWLGLALAGRGETEQALTTLRQVLERGFRRPELFFNLGRLLLGTGHPAEAVAHLEQALALNPLLAPAWFHLGQAQAALDHPAEAAAAYRRALEIDPRHTRAYVALGQVLLAQGEKAEALRYLRHGAAVAAEPEEVAAALAAVAGGG